MEDRFSLLYLEPGEIYFKDVAVTFCQDPDVKERLKLPTTSHLKSVTTTKKQDNNKSQGIFFTITRTLFLQNCILKSLHTRIYPKIINGFQPNF